LYVFLDIKCDFRRFLSPWKHLFADKIRFGCRQWYNFVVMAPQCFSK
jgi:hypothetical protein